MNEGNPLDQLSAEIGERARWALQQGFAMHDAAVILQATREFAEWVQVARNGDRQLTAPDVIQFFMSFAQAVVNTQVRQPEEQPIPGLD